MAPKGKWLFGSRKQSTSSGESDSSGTLTPTDSEGQDLVKTPSRLMKTFGGFRSSRSKKSTSLDYAHLNKPFTEQNLEHQKLLNAFAWDFGRRRSGHAHSIISGISPSASRRASIDSTWLSPCGGDRRDTHARFSSSLVRDAPQEASGEDSDRDSADDSVAPL